MVIIILQYQMYQTSTFYNLNICNVIYELYLNKVGKKEIIVTALLRKTIRGRWPV